MGGKKFDQNQCKVQLKLATTRLKLQKTKKENNVKNGKREIAELLKAGKDESARIRVESIIRDDFVIEAYDIMELFCELILARLGVINISKECPADIQEAVATIIYAAPRSDIKELQAVREQLIARFGKDFAMNAVHNKDNIVNARVVHKLSVQTPENYLVFQYLNEIAKSYNLDWKADFVPEPLKMDQLPQIPSSSSSSAPLPQSTRPTATAAVNEPSFPEVPSFSSSNTPIPTFDASSLPGGSNVSFPSPPSSSSSGIPDFPSPPSNSGPSIPDFPSPPTSRNTGLDFPSPPSSKSTNLDFPSPPGSSSSSSSTARSTGLDFPSPPTDTAKDSVPDFDELTARFEKLKKRDL
jgi:vacuolar protein sorting-associated protein IST1